MSTATATFVEKEYAESRGLVENTPTGNTVPRQHWKFTMFSCCQNGFVDCLAKTCFFNCAWGKAMEIAFGNSCILCCLGAGFCPGIVYIMSLCQRTQMREKYSLYGSKMDDFLSCFFCTGCHYIQMIHEIEAREKQTITCLGSVQPADQL